MKYVLKTEENGANLLSFTLLRDRCTPQGEEVHAEEITGHSLLKSLQTLQETQRSVH